MAKKINDGDIVGELSWFIQIGVIIITIVIPIPYVMLNTPNAPKKEEIQSQLR